MGCSRCAYGLQLSLNARLLVPWYPQVVTHRLPRLNLEEAGAVVFLGHDPKGHKCDDIAANPEVIFVGMVVYLRDNQIAVGCWAAPSNTPRHASSLKVWNPIWVYYFGNGSDGGAAARN